MKKGAFAPRSSYSAPTALSRAIGARASLRRARARLAGGRGALRQRLGEPSQMGPLPLRHCPASPRTCRACALEPLGLLGDGAETQLSKSVHARPSRLSVHHSSPPFTCWMNARSRWEPRRMAPVARARRLPELYRRCPLRTRSGALEDGSSCQSKPPTLSQPFSWHFSTSRRARGRLSSSKPSMGPPLVCLLAAASSRWGHGASRSRRACRRVGAAQDVYSDFDCGGHRGRLRWVELGRAVRASTGSAQASRGGACPFRPGRRSCRSGRSCSRSPLP